MTFKTSSTFPVSAGPFPDHTQLDGLFYDIGVLTHDERATLSTDKKVEGMVLEVGPSSAPSLKVWQGIAVCEGLAESYPAITVAGVGSSGLGAAALARNVADAFDQKVLAVVSGYGMTDLASEAMGGFFLFGGLNAMRHSMQSAEQSWADWSWMRPSVFGKPMRPMDPGEPWQLAHHSKDVKALVELITDRVSTRWLVGHSKGNLVISEALYALRAQTRARKRDDFADLVGDLEIITFGARIAMPPEIKTVIDVMGDLDTFGAMNSRPDIPVDIAIRNAWHHTNTALAFHVPVTEVVRGVLDKAQTSNHSC